MWLSAEESNVLDNALIIMEYLYRSGVVLIQLRGLVNEKSSIQIKYAVSKIMKSSVDDTEKLSDDEETVEENQIPEQAEFFLSKSDIEDHKRQLIFCKANLCDTDVSKKILLENQLVLLEKIEKIFSITLKLETVGHPDYQWKDESISIRDRNGKFRIIVGVLI